MILFKKLLSRRANDRILQLKTRCLSTWKGLLSILRSDCLHLGYIISVPVRQWWTLSFLRRVGKCIPRVWKKWSLFTLILPLYHGRQNDGRHHSLLCILPLNFTSGLSIRPVDGPWMYNTIYEACWNGSSDWVLALSIIVWALLWFSIDSMTEEMWSYLKNLHEEKQIWAKSIGQVQLESQCGHSYSVRMFLDDRPMIREKLRER